MDNVSRITEFTLSGLNETMNFRVTLFSLTLLCYCVILLVNVTLIVTIILDENLHDPMYILLCNMCINGLYGTAGFYPKLMFDLLSSNHVISYAGCMLQAFVIYSSACSDLSILALMAYDRYVAICRPLQYHSIMTVQWLAQLVCTAWFIPLSVISISSVLTPNLNLCSSHIPKLYCANWLIVKLSCSTTTANSTIAYITILIYFFHFVLIFASYVHVIRTCLKSIEDRGKFMQTCVPHLLSLFNVVMALLFDVMYMRFGSEDVTQGLKNFLSIEFLLVPPLVNPIIYGFKLTQIKNRICIFLTVRKNGKCIDDVKNVIGHT